MSGETKPFQSILDDDDSDLETLALNKGIAKLTKPPRASKSSPIIPEPTPVKSEQPPIMRPIKLDVPEYVWEQLKLQSVTQRCSMRHIIMRSLTKSGITIHKEDLVEDGRKKKNT